MATKIPKDLDIRKELETSQIVLMLMPSIEYSDVVREVIKIIADKPVCYVTLNKTFPSVKEDFERNNISTENMVFIDAITKTIRDVPDQTDKCYFVSSPGALTEISLTLSKILAHKFEYVVFDSLTNLLIYEQKAPVAKFVQMMSNKIRAANVKAVFFALSLKQQEALIEETSMFVDKVMDLDHNNM